MDRTELASHPRSARSVGRHARPIASWVVERPDSGRSALNHDSRPLAAASRPHAGWLESSIGTGPARRFPRGRRTTRGAADRILMTGRRRACEPDEAIIVSHLRSRPALRLPETRPGRGDRPPLGCQPSGPARRRSSCSATCGSSTGPRSSLRRRSIVRDGRTATVIDPGRPRRSARAEVRPADAKVVDGNGQDAASRADRLPHPHVHARTAQAGDRLRRDAGAGHVHRPCIRGPDAVGRGGGEGRRPRRPAFGRDARHGPRTATGPSTASRSRRSPHPNRRRRSSTPGSPRVPTTSRSSTTTSSASRA